MSKLLYIESSPRKNRSKSIAVAHKFIEKYKAVNPQDEIITLDFVGETASGVRWLHDRREVPSNAWPEL